MSLPNTKLSSALTVGVLSLQGDFERHIVSLKRVGATGCEVRTVDELAGLDALILPGGESTTMALLLHEFGMWQTLKSFAKTKPVWGTCAGLILLSSTIEDEKHESATPFAPLGVLDVTVARNAYGRQIHSFEDTVEISGGEERIVVPVSFIRAPKIMRTGKDVEVLATTNGEPTLVRQDNILGSAFHTELHEDTTFIRYFLAFASKVGNVNAVTTRSREVA